jgi:hypothetical protein
MKIVSITFQETTRFVSKPYAYLTDIDDISVGDTVVVDSPHNGFACVKVVSIEENAERIEKAYKWIVCKVDTKSYVERLEREERRQTVIAKLKKLERHVLEEDRFAMLAKHSPEASALLEELKTLK